MKSVNHHVKKEIQDFPWQGFFVVVAFLFREII